MSKDSTSHVPTTSAVSAACPRCGVIDRPTIGPGNGPHPFRAACRHCGHFLGWRSKVPQADRQARRQQALKQAMATKPPSESQLSYLAALGYSGPQPNTMAEASAKIDAIKCGSVVTP